MSELALPVGLSLPEYDGNVLMGGWVTEPEACEGSESTPQWRRSAGVIAQFNAEQPEPSTSEYWCAHMAESGSSTGWLVFLDAAQFA